MFDKSNQCTIREKHVQNDTRSLRCFDFLTSKNYGQHLLDIRQFGFDKTQYFPLKCFQQLCFCSQPRQSSKEGRPTSSEKQLYLQLCQGKYDKAVQPSVNWNYTFIQYCHKIVIMSETSTSLNKWNSRTGSLTISNNIAPLIQYNYFNLHGQPRPYHL